MGEEAGLHFGGACERCGRPTTVRMMSYFMEQMICQRCHASDTAQLERLARAGEDVQSYAGCGYLPGPADVAEREES